MGHVDDRDPEIFLDVLDLQLHLLAKLLVQGAKRDARWIPVKL